jgi:hypothetical protein
MGVLTYFPRADTSGEGGMLLVKFNGFRFCADTVSNKKRKSRTCFMTR